MILPFSNYFKNGKPTYFVERIWEGLLRNIFEDDTEYQQYLRLHKKQFGNYWPWFPDAHPRLEYPKVHTFREDLKDRWHVGTKIDFFINCRQKDMFRFAPVLPVVSTQKVEITWKENTISFKYLGLEFDRSCIIKIDNRFFGDVYLLDGKVLTSSYNLPELAMNDGFDTLEDFLAYFKEDFKGKIIHWTDLKY